MKPTPARLRNRPSRLHVGVVSLIAGMVAALLMAMVGSAAAATTAEPNAASSSSVTQASEEPITVDDIVQLVDGFEATGEVTLAGAHRMRFVLWFVQYTIDRGNPELAIGDLETFKDLAANPRYVPSESARDVLIAAADQLIEQLRDG